MASLAAEAKPCECACQSSGGSRSCNCVCDAPCAFNADNKTLDWSCACKNKEGENSCGCSFQIRCRCQELGGCDGNVELVTSECKCGKPECSIQIRKCRGCEVIRSGCQCLEGEGGDAGDSCCGKKTTQKCCDSCTCVDCKCSS